MANQELTTGQAQYLGQLVPITEIIESPHNPRKHFDVGKLNDLALSIRQHGILTPLLARPTKSGAKELATGHRRFRAAQIAGLENVPVIVRPMTDQELLEILTIENLQREDVHPIEEAEGFEQLLERGGYTAAAIADKIGKTEAYVRGRLELLDLVPVVRESFFRNAITIGHARIISRIRPDQQEDALRRCFHRDWRSEQEELVTLREFTQIMRQERGTDLAKAPFALDDGSLTADAPACTICPRCTGTQRSLLADDTAEQMCLDRACYGRKLEAHLRRRTAAGLVAISTFYRHTDDVPPGVLLHQEYAEVGVDKERIQELEEQIAGAEGELAAASDSEKASIEDEINGYRQEIEEERAYSKSCPHAERAILVHGGGYHEAIGSERLICRNPECPIHGEQLRDNADVSANQARGVDPKRLAEQEKKKRARKLDQAIRRRAWETLLGAVAQHGEVTPRVLFLAATGLFHAANLDFCKAFGIPAEKGDWRPAKKWAANASDTDLMRFIVGAALAQPGLAEFFDKQYQGADEWRWFKATLDDYDVDLAAIERDVREDFKAAEAKKRAKAKKKAKTDKPAKQVKSSKMAAAGDEEDDDGEE